MNPSELKQIASQLQALSKKSQDDKPKTDDELHTWIKENLGLNIPRVAVCPGHNAPFDLVADLFFNRVESAILMASRGAGKTMTAALLNFLNCYFEEEIECASVGAVEIQAKRAYQHLKTFNRIAQKKLGDNRVVHEKVSDTVYTTGAKYEILTGSVSSVNGPHPQFVHRDEIELMDGKVFNESLQMERGKTTSDGVRIKPQTLITSTRKTSDGLMQKLLDECKEAEDAGRRAPYKIYIYCIKECAENQPNCRVANPDLPEDEKCDCDQLYNGELSEGMPRTLEKVCNGAFGKANGFTPMEDIQQLFLKSSKAMWEAQQECGRPYAEDLSLENWARERNCIKNYRPDPDNGPIYQGIDWGGTNPHAVEWIQVLKFEVEAVNFFNEIVRIPEGARIVFDEIYIAEIGNGKLADMIVENEKEWKKRYPKFRVSGRFADPQGKINRLDFAHHDPPLKCSWPIVTRDREEHKKRISDCIDDRLFYVDIERCPMFVEEVEAWNIANKTFDHAVDATMYGISNISAIEGYAKRHGTGDLPHANVNRGKIPGHDYNDNLPSAIPSEHTNLPETERWRLGLGGIG
jgi:hypothetical protein